MLAGWPSAGIAESPIAVIPLALSVGWRVARPCHRLLRGAIGWTIVSSGLRVPAGRSSGAATQGM
jgi:hypothetical protein